MTAAKTDSRSSRPVAVSLHSIVTAAMPGGESVEIVSFVPAGWSVQTAEYFAHCDGLKKLATHVDQIFSPILPDRFSLFGKLYLSVYAGFPLT